MMRRIWLLGAATLGFAGCGDAPDSDGDGALAPEPGGSAQQEPADAAAADDGGAAAGTAACMPSGDLAYLCGPLNAEDLVQIPESRWLIASGMSAEVEGVAMPGRLYLVDHEQKAQQEWFPGGQPTLRHDTEAFPACPGPLDLTDFSAHGLALGSGSSDGVRLYMTSHGAREAIEVFDVDASAEPPTIAWIGCVVLPEQTFANSVAVLADGGFVTTKMMDPTVDDAFADILAGRITGNVYEWHPGEEVEAVAGTELSGANGIALSADQRYLYVAAIGSREIVRFDRQAQPIAKEAVTIDVRPDNLRWSDRGTLYTVGGNYVSPDECQGPGCATGWSVIEIDPETLAANRVAGADQNAALQGASTALPVDDEIWIGTFSGDRIGYLPRP